MQRMRFRLSLSLSLLLAACAGCSEKKPVAEAPTEIKKPAPSEAVPEESKEPTDGLASLQGRIVFQGKVPEAVKISVTKDVEFCSQHVDERSEVQIAASGGLAGVVVEVRGVAPPETGWQWQEPEDGYVIRQKDCSFQPALLVIPEGKEVKVLNDDPVAHNINSGQWNFMQAAGAEPIIQKVASRGALRVGCNIHSWMEGWIYPAKSSFYSVSDAEGNYEINQIPPGKYRVTAWHPSLRLQRESIELSGSVKKEFVFESPY